MIRNYSYYSIGLSVSSVEDIIASCEEREQKIAVLTDKNSLAGVLPFLSAKSKCDKVFGVDLKVSLDSSKRNYNKPYISLLVLVKSEIAYRNLSALLTIASRPENSFLGHDIIDVNDLIKHKDGLVVLSSCSDGIIGSLARSGDFDLAEEWFLRLKEEFGENFYAELIANNKTSEYDQELKDARSLGYNAQKFTNHFTLTLAKKHNVKTVISAFSYSLSKKNLVAQMIMGTQAEQRDDYYNQPDEIVSQSIAEMRTKFSEQGLPFNDLEWNELIVNTTSMLDSCKNVKLKFDPVLPKVDYSKLSVNSESMSKEYDERLNAFVAKISKTHPGLAKQLSGKLASPGIKSIMKLLIKNNKLNLDDQVVLSRLEAEFKTIEYNGYIRLSDYFLLLEFVTSFLHKNGYLNGPGRGSGAGSIVVYGLNVTDVNPIENQLLFERFLQNDRISSMEFDLKPV